MSGVDWVSELLDIRVGDWGNLKGGGSDGLLSIG